MPCYTSNLTEHLQQCARAYFVLRNRTASQITFDIEKGDSSETYDYGQNSPEWQYDFNFSSALVNYQYSKHQFLVRKLLNKQRNWNENWIVKR